MFRRDFFTGIFGASLFSLFNIKSKNKEIPILDLRLKKSECCVINEKGDIQFYKDGKLHRDGDLPSMFRPDSDGRQDGFQYYHKNGRLHRDNNKPAIIISRYFTGYPKYYGIEVREYWVNGRFIREEKIS